MVIGCCYHYMHIHFNRNRLPPRGFPRLKYPDSERLRPNYRRLVTLLSRLLPLHVIPEESVTERNYQSLDQLSVLVDAEFEFLFLDWDVDLPIATRRGSFNVFVHRLFDTSAEINDISRIVRWMLSETLSRNGLNDQKIGVINALLRQTDPNGIFTADALDVMVKLMDTPNDEEGEVAKWRGLMLFTLKRISAWNAHLRDSIFGTEYIAFWRSIYDFDSRGEGFRGLVVQQLPILLPNLLYSNESLAREKAAGWAMEIIPQFLEDETVAETLATRSLAELFTKLCWHTELFLERKITISERYATVQSVVPPVLVILRLIVITFPGVQESAEKNIESMPVVTPC